MSWAVGPAQRNMNSTALELWGLQRALLSLGHLATGRQINVISDNIGLTSFTNLRIGNARERRLLAFLQMYDLHLHYCPGAKHVGSDFLSRFISDLTPAQRVEFQPPNDQDAIDDYLFAIHSQLPQQTESGANSTTQRSWSVYFVDKQPGDPPSVTVNVITEGHNTFVACNNASDSVTSNGEHQVNPHLNGKFNAHTKSSDAHMDETRCQPIIFSADKPSDDYQAQNVVSANGLNINATPFVPTSDRVVLFNQCLNVDSKYASVNHEESTTVNKAQVMSEDHVPSYSELISQGTTGLDVLANNMELHSHDSANGHTVNATRKLRRKTSHAGDDHPISAPDSADTTEDSEESSPPCHLPKLGPQHYTDDPEFSHIWKYLTTNELSGHQPTDYKTMIVAPLYVIEDEKLFRFDMPCSKKRSADGPVRKVLAIPQAFQEAILLEFHHTHGHCSAQRLFETARLHIYFKTLYAACNAVALTCPTCQQVKIDRRKQIPELHSMPWFPLGTVFLLDHKMLPRKTSEGHVAILVMTESYSGFTYLEPVHDLTALTTAKALIRRVLPHHLNLRGLISDKGSAFVAKIFRIITRKLLDLYTWTSASLHAQSHGQVENIIGQLNKLLPIYAAQDSEIADASPILEIVLRTTISKPRAYSAYEILYGHTPNLRLMGAEINNDTTVPPSINMSHG
jgi:hypothetical protein